jgi:hypothetical protein
MAHDSQNSHATHRPAAPDADVLIGRLLDREASDDERRTFERLADGEGRLWKTLALRQLDMSDLTAGVEAVTLPAERVEAPAAAPRRWHAAFSLSGWAAALLLGAFWAAAPRQAPGPRVDPAVKPPPAEVNSPDEHLRRYLGSDFVIGEHDPILLEQEDLGDGRHKVWFIRRIEESAIIDRPVDEVVTEAGAFLVDPAKLRKD